MSMWAPALLQDTATAPWASEDGSASTACTLLCLIAVVKVALDGVCCDRKQLYANKRLRKCE